jgi:hypothetical protein
VNRLLIVDRLPNVLPMSADTEYESSGLQEEFDLARRIIQGHSAVYLLAQVAHRTQVEDLELTLDQIGTWITEFESAVQMKAKGNSLATRLLSAIPDVRTAQVGLERLIRLPSTVGASAHILALVEKTYNKLGRIFAHTPLASAFFANGCACEVENLAEARSK